MDKDIDSLSEKEQQYFFDNITYELIHQWMIETQRAALIEGVTEENYIKEKINVNKILKRFG